MLVMGIAPWCSICISKRDRFSAINVLSPHNWDFRSFYFIRIYVCAFYQDSAMILHSVSSLHDSHTHLSFPKFHCMFYLTDSHKHNNEYINRMPYNFNICIHYFTLNSIFLPSLYCATVELLEFFLQKCTVIYTNHFLFP